MNRIPFSAQLYTRRDLVAKDFAGTVQQVAVFGTSRGPACGYDLRASPDRCPECGTSSHGNGAVAD